MSIIMFIFLLKMEVTSSLFWIAQIARFRNPATTLGLSDKLKIQF